MASRINTLFYPRGFATPTVRTLPADWQPISAGLANSLSIEALANYLAGYDAVTYSPARLANMTANDMRYAQNLILNYQA